MEPLTPVQIEQHLRGLHRANVEAGLAAREARNAELDALQALEDAKAAIEARILDGEFPNTTVSEKQMIVDRHTKEQRKALNAAKTARKNAETYVREVEQSIKVGQSVRVSVSAAYQSGQS